ncbi:phosphoglycerate mutase family protein [Alteromonas sp. D210916BOD_24]|uniref:histidine phosphatase family protein n=1 Tax=Alteromonas sp. D210916BOD_24 TaxID=3157618 RepID=UPI00399CBC00
MKSILFLTLFLCIVPGSIAGDFTLYFTRHFEKQTGTNPALTQQGVEKAQAFASLLEHAGIKKVYSTNYRRTQQSAAPIALKVNTAVTFYDPRDLTKLAAKLLSEQQNAVVVGHSNTTPDIIGLVGGEANPISETEFGDVYMLRYSTQSQSGEPLGKPVLVNTVHVKLQ